MPARPPAEPADPAAAGAGACVVHGSAVAVGEDAVLLRGAPGAGKSDLALRLIGLGTWPAEPPPSLRLPQPIRLVADDRVQLHRADDRLQAGAPASIAGRLEVRGLGILEVAHVRLARLRLVVDLVAREAVPRLAEPGERVPLAGVEVERLALWAFEPSAPFKVLLALDVVLGRRRRLEDIAPR